MKKIIIGLVVLILVLVGCIKYVDVVRNVTINHTIIINNTIIEKCNTTFNDKWDISESRELELIRRIRVCENQREECVFDMECHDDLEDTEEDLDDCEDDLDDIEEELDESIEDLGDCKEEICEDYNATEWC